MESYQEFMSRISSFEKPTFSIDQKGFTPSQSVLNKVKDDNTFAYFYGDTVVFDLAEEEKEKIAELIQTLYLHASQCFCEELSASTLHMTLHDLSSAVDKSTVMNQMFQNVIQLSKVLETKKALPQLIHMRSNYLINMVNTSVVLALYPVDEVEYLKLMYWYEAVDEVLKLPYPFTPHITLAYYNRDGFDENAAINLIKVIGELNQTSFDITLNTADLVYQRFQSMNHYETVFPLIK